MTPLEPAPIEADYDNDTQNVQGDRSARGYFIGAKPKSASPVPLVCRLVRFGGRMSTQWYPRYPGDYGRKTGQLTFAEHGAYTLLLDHYYGAGPLDDDFPGLVRICRAFDPHEQDALRKVLDLFFPVNGDGKRHNKRADAEMAKQAEISEKRARAGAKGAQVKWESAHDSAAQASASTSEPSASKADGKRDGKCQSNANTTTTTATTTSTGTSTRGDTPHTPRVTADQVEAIYQQYPRKEGKQPGLVQIRKALKAVPFDDLMEATVAYAEAVAKWPEDALRFVPHPGTWYGQQRWTDDRAEWERKGKPEELDIFEIREREAKAKAKAKSMNPTAASSQSVSLPWKREGSGE